MDMSLVDREQKKSINVEESIGVIEGLGYGSTGGVRYLI